MFNVFQLSSLGFPLVLATFDSAEEIATGAKGWTNNLITISRNSSPFFQKETVSIANFTLKVSDWGGKDAPPWMSWRADLRGSRAS